MQENNARTLYLSLEKTIKNTARIMAMSYKVDQSDLLSVANEAFMKALTTFDDSKGASIKTWCVGTIKHSIQDECKKQKLNNDRFFAISGFVKDDFDLLYFIVDENPSTNQNTLLKELELKSELRKFSKSAQKYALTRMKGYNAHEIAKYRLMSRREILNAKKEIESCHK